MDHIKWERIDDREFIHIVADLLRSIGFIDVHIQGDGPDGGLDLIATELVRFAIQGAQAFTWGIQCKFSKAGARKAVNDNEIKDVEGILRSDRYSGHRLRGYMIITNRRIVQNVIERLQGIDRGSQFRTASLEGVQLNRRLAEQPELIEKYSQASPRRVEELGLPTLLQSQVDDKARHLVAVEAWSEEDQPRRTVMAILDTGASMSVIPESTYRNVGPSVCTVRKVTSAASTEPVLAQACILNLRIGDLVFRDHEVLVLNTHYAILGQDILKNYSVLFDGPNQAVKVWLMKAPAIEPAKEKTPA